MLNEEAGNCNSLKPHYPKPSIRHHEEPIPKQPQTDAPEPEVRVRPVLEREVEHGFEPRKSSFGVI